MPKLTKELVDEYNKARANASTYEEYITDRIDEVIRVIAKALGNECGKYDSWWFPNAPEGGIGTVDISGEYLYLHGELISALGDYSDIYTSFLYMEDDEIIKEIRDDIAAEKKRKQKQKEAREAKKKEKENLRKSAVAKLTKAELKAIKGS